MRHQIRLLPFEMTAHAMKEMAENGLDMADIAGAGLRGRPWATTKGCPYLYSSRVVPA